MRRLLTVGSLLLLAGSASIAHADPITESPQPQKPAVVVQATRPTLPVAAGAKALSNDQKASVDGQHICWKRYSGNVVYKFCLPNLFFHRHP